MARLSPPMDHHTYQIGLKDPKEDYECYMSEYCGTMRNFLKTFRIQQ